MALDGIVLNNLVFELNETIKGRKINKIFQYNANDIYLVFQNTSLLISANPTFPRLYLTNVENNNQDKVPNFCMMLKKYILGGIITDITQSGLDRIITIDILILNDFKEQEEVKLIVEIMGKYSNIILVNKDNVILDSIKHVTSAMSSVRTVLPRLDYIIPKEDNKLQMKSCSEEEIKHAILSFEGDDFTHFITSNFLGISKLIADNYKTHVSSEISLTNILKFKDYLLNDNDDKNEIKNTVFLDISMQTKIPVDFYVKDLDIDKKQTKMYFDTTSEMLDYFFKHKARSNNLKQKSGDLKGIISNNLTKALKKKKIHLDNIDKCNNHEKYKIYGELIFSNIYNIKKGMSEVTVLNYYDDNEEITLRLDPNLTPNENATKFYNRYNKLKSTFKHAVVQLKDIDKEIVYLETLESYLENALNYSDLNDIRDELVEGGYLKKKIERNKKGKIKKEAKSEPLCFTSSDGYKMYIGRNNIQNDEVTFKIGRENDLWLHVQDIPGSHVIIKLNGEDIENLPETTLNEAATLGVYFSKGRNSAKVPIDYTLRKFVKKPSGSKPGFVIFLNNKTLFITPSEEILKNFNIEL